MKIVVKYELDGGYDCGSYQQTLCFNYESTEAFLVNFEIALKAKLAEVKATREKEGYHYIKSDFVFCGHEFDASDFIVAQDEWMSAKKHKSKTEEIELPDVFELEEWFESNCKITGE